MSTITFEILGPLQVRSGERHVPLDGARQERALAALLLNADRTVTIEHLIDVVWEEPPATARRQIQDIVPRLRRRLLSTGAPSDIISTERAGYLLRLGASSLDAHTFEELVTAGHELIPVDITAAAAKLREALLLWRGEMLTGIRSRRLESTSRIWQDRHLTVWEECLALELARGNNEVITELRTLVERFPLRESMVGLLMLALHTAGRRVEALDAFQALRKQLAGDLGLDPGGDLQQMHAAILRSGPDAEFVADPIALLRRFRFAEQSARSPGPGGEAAPEAPADAVPPTAGQDGPYGSDPAPSAAHGPRSEGEADRSPAARRPTPSGLPIPAQLPLDPRGFTGRREALARLDSLAAAGDGALTETTVLAVTGTAGVGKTALAVHWAHGLADRFPDGQLHVDLRGFGPDGEALDPAEAVRGFLDALRVAPEHVPADLAGRAALYRSLLAGRRMLIVLDNARDAAHVRPLLPGTAGCLVVVTSRDRLTGLVAAEGARPVPLGPLTAAESAQLLAARLGADRPAAEPRATDEIVGACAGLPLALVVAAALAATHDAFPLRVLADRLGGADSALETLTAGDPFTDVRSVLSWSYRTLSPDAARLFRLLGLHPGPDAAVPAAASLAGVPERRTRALLAELAAAHLVEEHVPGRYTFHGLLRAYAAALAHSVDDEESRSAAEHRLLDHYLHTGLTAALLLDPGREPIDPAAPSPGVRPEVPGDFRQALSWFTAEHAVLLAVVGQAAHTDSGPYAWQLAWTLTGFLDRRGHRHDPAAAGRPAPAVPGRPGDPPGLPGPADTHLTIGHVLGGQGLDEDALDHAERGLELFRRAGHTAGQADALIAVGRACVRLGEYAQAVAHSERALALHEELGDTHGQAMALDGLGTAHHHLGRFREAIGAYERAVRLLRDDGAHRYPTALTLIRLGEAYEAAGDHGPARCSWGRALRILDELGHPDADRVRPRLGTVGS